MKNRVLAILLAAMMGLSVTACGSTTEKVEAPSVTVSGILPAQGDVIVETAYIGTVTPMESVTVFPMVSGNVTEMSATLGKQVKKGDALFNVDNTQASQTLEEAKKELEAVKKNADAAKKEAETAAKEAENAKKEAEVANLKTLEEAVKTKQAEVNQAKNNWESAKDKLEDLEKDYDRFKDGKLTLTYSEERTLKKDIENAEKARDTAKTAYDNAVKAHEKAKTDLANAKSGKTTNSVTSTTNKNNTTNSAANTTNTVTTLYDEQLAAAEKKVAEAQEQLNLYQVKAPFDGVVEAVYIEKNEKVFENSPCVVVSNSNSLEVVFQVPEAAAGALHAGENVRVEKDGAMNEATITEVAMMADPETKLFPVKASMGNVSGFTNGATVKVFAETKKALGVLKIPYDALYFQGSAAYVYCIEDDVAVRKEVQVGLMNDDSVEILAGLEEQDVVISTWSSQLKDGVDVNLLFVIGYEEPVEEVTPEPTLEVVPSDQLDTENTEEEYTWVLQGMP